MSLVIKSFFVVLTLLSAGVLGVSAQGTDASSPFPGRNNRRDEEENKIIKEMLAKQQAEQDKKDFAEMMERAEEALTISGELEKSFAASEHLSAQDKKKLANLEKLVVKIREELGGDDDESEKELDAAKPSTVKEAFGFLRSSTVKLVDELKKTSRFSISAVAIKSSNTVIRLARFLRFRS